MGNFTSHNEPTFASMYYDAAWSIIKNKGNDYCLKFDRILDAENQIYLGIGTRDKILDDGKSLQVIRIGDYKNKYNRLVGFSEEKNKLIYKFENDIAMTIMKEDDKFQLNLSDLNKNKHISKEIDLFIIKYFKKINLASDEFDKIHELFQNKK